MNGVWQALQHGEANLARMMPWHNRCVSFALMSSALRPPVNTYRIQLSSSFTLGDLTNVVPYLSELGVTDVYLSPIYTARPGSPHGYDIVDHGTINRELGGDEAWTRLCAALRHHGMGVVLDVVPNHMAADPVHNQLWRQVLAHGPASPSAHHFDVDWRPLTGLIRDKVLLPVLEEPYGAALMQGRIVLQRAVDDIRVRYGSLHLPLASGTVDAAISDDALGEINADPQRLHAVLESQHYRLAYWRAANDEINYRRFFDVNELIAIRPEEDDVFDRSHELVVRLSRDDVVCGLRVDHVDGVLDPKGYLRRLRAVTSDVSHRPMWIVVEKILGRVETLDAAWPVEGTTGYDALNVINRLFVSGRGLRLLRRFYQRLVADQGVFAEIGYESKLLVMRHPLRSGLTLLSHALKRVGDASWTTRDITLNALSTALMEFIACLPVYRTYLGNGSDPTADRDAVEQAFVRAARGNPSIDMLALSFLRSLHLDEVDDPSLAEMRRRVVQRLQQYTSGVQAKGIEDTAYYRDNTLLALNEVGGDPGGPSGTLDEFHRFNERRVRYWPHSHSTSSTHDTKLGEDARIRIAALTTCASEWITSVQGWLRANTSLRHATAKGNSIDVNDEYRMYQVLIGLWPADDASGPAPADAGLVERVAEYMRKAIREAKVRTSWIRVNEEYEGTVDSFVRGILTDEAGREFRCSLRAMVQRVLPTSTCHSISQLVLKCLIPGVADTYQGVEGWALVITDPDNRRPVDFGRRYDSLREVMAKASSMQAASAREAGRDELKHLVTARLLRFRREHREMIMRARYAPMRARGTRASAVVAFRRSVGKAHVVVAVPRLVNQSMASGAWPVGDFWDDTQLRVPSNVAVWTHVLNGEAVSMNPAGRAALAELTASWPWLVLYGRE